MAVKLIHPFGFDRDDRFRRLRTERQILANLRHPGIARVFDGGITPEGWPYMVMDVVDGRPVTQYCREKNTDLTGRLNLFLRICDAVIHAHRNLVLHRDLKPGNILVTESGDVKLLDFGIAKLLESENGAAPLTQTGRPLMTPEYAAPEQFKGDAVSTSVDVYGLGVLFYELMAGIRPYDFEGKSLSDIENIVCEVDPPKPSEASARSSPGTGAACSPDRLRGDLDIICLKALRKQPDDRYGSVRDFQEDINRYLNGLPITARPATTGYRVTKFIQRHRAGIAALALLILLVTGFIAALLYHQSVTLRERDRAQLEALKATEVTDFLLGLFEANEPLSTPTDTITARALLERGVMRAEEMREQPGVQAQMLEVMGRVYQSLGRYDHAEPLLRKALALREHHPGEDPTEVAGSLNQLGELLMARGKYPEAGSLFNRSIGLMHTIFGEKDSSVAVTMNNLAMLQEKQGNYSEAETLHRQVLEMRREIFGHSHPDVSASLHNLANVLYLKGQYGEAGALYRDALDMKRRHLGDTHASTAQTMLGLATSSEAAGDFYTADSLYRETLAIQRRLLGNEHPRIAYSLSRLGELYLQTARYAEAESVLLEAFAIRQNELGASHPETTQLARQLLSLYESWNKPGQAARYRALVAEGA